MARFLSGAFTLFVLPALVAAGVKRLPAPLGTTVLVLIGGAAVLWLVFMWISITGGTDVGSGISKVLGALLVGGSPILGIYLGYRYL